MPSKTGTDERWRRIALIAWALVGVVVLGLALLRLLDLLSSALMPFLLALVIVFLLRTPVVRLERHKVPRAVAVLIAYVLAALVVAVAGLIIVPRVVDQFVQFLAAFPSYYRAAYRLWSDLQRQYQTVALPGWVDQAFGTANETIVTRLSGFSTRIATGAVAAGSGVVGLILNLVLALVIAFYVLKDLPTIREEVLSMFGHTRRSETAVVLGQVSTVLSGFLRGQLIVSTIVGTLTFIGLAVLGVPYAFVIGLITGVFNIIPYFGPIVGGITAAIAAAFESPLLALGALAVVFAVQQVDGLLISPRVMSDKVDLHPVLVIFSLLAGGTLFGFVGLLLAIPVAAVAKALFVYYFEKHSEHSLSSEAGALFRKSPPKRGRRAEGCESDDEDGKTSSEEAT